VGAAQIQALQEETHPSMAVVAESNAIPTSPVCSLDAGKEIKAE